MARRASFIDSIKASYGQVLVVDNGAFFPEDDLHRDAAWFMMDAMKVLALDAVAIGDKELRFGLDFLRSHVKRTQLPAVSSNLVDIKTRRPIFAPYLIRKAGSVKVGFFSLMNEKVDQGPARDSVEVLEPTAVAKRTILEIRKKGATVVVLLSQLGKVESEDLVTTVDGIDVVIVGRQVPLLQRGRMIENTVACYGGEQGQYMGRTSVTLNAQRRMTTAENEMFMLGPEVGEKKEMAQLVKAFEDDFNEKLRKAEKERAAKAQAEKVASREGDHFLGTEVCIRCHVSEGEQWKTTSHSVAWKTLVDIKKDATPDCIACHVVGINQPGGFRSGTETPKMVNVGCENCHGMGTKHEAFAAAPRQITEQTCTTCHHGDNDPTWNFAAKLPKIAHSNLSGETIKNKKGTMPAMMKSSAETGGSHH